MVSDTHLCLITIMSNHISAVVAKLRAIVWESMQILHICDFIGAYMKRNSFATDVTYAMCKSIMQLLGLSRFAGYQHYIPPKTLKPLQVSLFQVVPLLSILASLKHHSYLMSRPHRTPVLSCKGPPMTQLH